MTGARLLREIVSGPEVAMYVADKLNVDFALPYRTLGLKIGGVIVAGVVFNVYTKHDIEVTVAVDYVSRAFIRRVGRYIFEELGCIRCMITTESDKVSEIAIRLGAKPEGRKRNQYGYGRDGFVFGILREDWTIT